MPLAAFLTQPHPEPAVLSIDTLDHHAERRADPGERIDHQPEQRAVAQAGMRRDIDVIEQRALPPDRAQAFARTSQRAGARVPSRPDDWHELAGDKPIKQVTDRGQALLDARRCERARAGFDPGGDVHRLQRADRSHAGARLPGQRVCGLRMLD